MRTDLPFEIWPELSKSAVSGRDFIYFWVRDRGTGDLVEQGFWTGTGSILAPVIDARTRLVVNRQFEPMGGVPFSVADIPLTSDVTVRSIEVTLSAIDDAVEAAVRLYNLKFAPVQLYRGIFSADTRNLVTPALPRFVGIVNNAPIVTPKVNESGSLSLTIVSQSRELTKPNPSLRSDADQQARTPGDRFFQYVDLMKDATLYWGEVQGPLT